MKKCSVSAVALLAWLLMFPPPKMPPVKAPDGSYEVNSALPISSWLVLHRYTSEAACKRELKQMPKYYRCVSSDNPALKRTAATAPKAAPAPSRSAPHAAANSRSSPAASK
jgi:hypothetical protein